MMQIILEGQIHSMLLEAISVDEITKEQFFKAKWSGERTEPLGTHILDVLYYILNK